jgi:hypothetical protein
MVFSLNKKTIISLDPIKLNFENIDENFENKVITSGAFTIDEELNITGSMETSVTEQNNPYYSLLEDSTAAKFYLKNGLASKADIQFEVINSAQYRSLIHYNIETKEPYRKQNDYYFLELPFNKLGVSGWKINYFNIERKTHYELPGIIDEQYSYTFEVPEHIKLVNPVELTEKKYDIGELVLMIQQEGNKITVKKMLVINQDNIPPGQYQSLKEMMDLWNNKNRSTLILKKESNP